MNQEHYDSMKNEINEQPEVLKRLIAENEAALGMLSRNLIPKINIGAINNVMIVARGSSDNAAMIGKYLIETKVGLPVSLAAPSVVNLYHAPLKLFQTLVIGVSQSGKTNEILDFLAAVKDKSGFTIGVTNEVDSALANLGLNVNLFCNAGIEKAIAATKSFSATMMLFYILSAVLAQDAEMLKMLEAVPGLAETTLKLEDKIIEISQWLSGKEECVILARGYNYPIALEIGLKLQESSYLRAKSFSSADFQHGPLAITQPGIPFLILEAEGPSHTGLDWLSQEIVNKGGDVLVFSTKPDENGLKSYRLFKLPNTAEWLSPFVFIIAGQLLAYHTARIRGINPNQPRWLNKVTTTI